MGGGDVGGEAWGVGDVGAEGGEFKEEGAVDELDVGAADVEGLVFLAGDEVEGRCGFFDRECQEDFEGGSFLAQDEFTRVDRILGFLHDMG